MNAARIIAERVAPFWLTAERITGDAVAVASAAMGQRYLKADGKSLTQFNTGALVVRRDGVLALTECQPHRRDPSVRLVPPAKARAAVVEDVRQHGPPLLAVLFRKGAIDVRAWVCCTEDEVVLNGPAGPEEFAALEDVALLKGLPGSLKAWRTAAALYARARADLSLAPRLYAEADKLSAATRMAADAVMDTLHHLHRVQALAYELADTTPRGER